MFVLGYMYLYFHTLGRGVWFVCGSSWVQGLPLTARPAHFAIVLDPIYSVTQTLLQLYLS